MPKLLSPNSRFYDSWNNAANLVLINLLTLIFTIPLITAGAAFAATARVACEMVREEDTYVIRTWLRAFRENFQLATLAWIPAALLLLGFWYEERLLGNFTDPRLSGMLLGVILFGVAIIISFLCWYFPLIARYRNSFGAHLANAFRLMLGRLPQTLLCVGLCFTPAMLVVFFPKTLLPVCVFMVIIGVAFIAYLIALIQKSTFARLDITGLD